MILYAFKRGVWDPLKAIVVKRDWHKRGRFARGAEIYCRQCGCVVAAIRSDGDMPEGRPKVWLRAFNTARVRLWKD